MGVDSAITWLNNSPDHSVFVLEGINTPNSEMAPSWMDGQFSFSSDRLIGRSDWKAMNEETGASYYEIYTANLDKRKFFNINPLYDKEKNPYHEGPATFTEYGTSIIYSAIDYKPIKGKLIYTLDLIHAEVIGDELIGEETLCSQFT